MKFCYYLVVLLRRGVIQAGRTLCILLRITTFIGVKVLTHSITLNHFHILVWVADGQSVSDVRLCSQVAKTLFAISC